MVTAEQQYISELNQSRYEDAQDENISVKSGSSESPNFVVFLLVGGAAAIVDLIDTAELTGILAFLTKPIDIPTLGFLWLWRISQSQAGPKKDVTFQILLAFMVELSPFGIIPTWTIFVAYVYFKDTKLGKQTIGKVQKITSVKKT